MTIESLPAKWREEAERDDKAADAHMANGLKNLSITRATFALASRLRADELEAALAHRQDGELLALCRQIVDEAMPATASGQTCFVPRYQLDKLRALSQPSEPSKSQVKRIALERGESPGQPDSGEVGND